MCVRACVCVAACAATWTNPAGYQPTDQASELTYFDYYMKPTSAAHFTQPPPVVPGLTAGASIDPTAEGGTGFTNVRPTTTRFPEQPAAFGSAAAKDAVTLESSDPDMYQSVSRVGLNKAAVTRKDAPMKILRPETLSAGYATAAGVSASRVFGL